MAFITFQQYVKEKEESKKKETESVLSDKEKERMEDVKDDEKDSKEEDDKKGEAEKEVVVTHD